MPREKHKCENHEARVPKRSTGTDRPVVAMRVSDGTGQRGWIGWPHHRSTGNGRKRCVQQNEAALAASFA